MDEQESVLNVDMFLGFVMALWAGWIVYIGIY